MMPPDLSGGGCLMTTLTLSFFLSFFLASFLSFFPPFVLSFFHAPSIKPGVSVVLVHLTWRWLAGWLTVWGVNLSGEREREREGAGGKRQKWEGRECQKGYLMTFPGTPGIILCTPGKMLCTLGRYHVPWERCYAPYVGSGYVQVFFVCVQLCE
jgi:hypothetical protein